MPTFMVERSLPGIPMDALAAAQKRAIDTAAKMSRDGEPVRYLHSAFVPGDGRCMCFFEAPDAAQVERLNRTAEIPFDRVVAALDLRP
ncbi:MAG TPA: DUF4242 domain-containing protein [Burkholderiaceae bacterium]|jgi:hypothetical protein|nr:DUF4242 domain-containing protein [Burkholderiaceae bacterium]